MRERRRAGAKQDGANLHASPNHDKGEEAGDNDPVMAGPNLVTVSKELQSRPCIEGNSHQRICISVNDHPDVVAIRVRWRG